MDLLEWMNAAVIQPLQQSDRALMLKINREWTFSALDDFTLFMRNAKMHIPLYLFFLYFAFKKMGRKAWYWLLSAALLIAFSDLISSHLIKPFCKTQTLQRSFFLRPGALAGNVLWCQWQLHILSCCQSFCHCKLFCGNDRTKPQTI